MSSRRRSKLTGRGGVPLILPLLLAVLLPTACVAQARCNSSDAVIPSSCGDNAECKDFLCRCSSSYFSPTGTATDCISVSEPNPSCLGYDSQCVYCGVQSFGPCVKCVQAITNSGVCVDSCPSGDFSFTINPISIGNFTISARVCDESSSGDNSAIPSWAVVLIIVLGGVCLLAVCTVCIIVSIIYLSRVSSGQFEVEDSERMRQHNLRPPSRSSSFGYERQTDYNGHGNGRDSAQFTGLENPTFGDDLEDMSEEDVFLQKLAYLRGQAQVFLKMLNDMRRRLKELPPGSPASRQYRNVMSDITRLLYLLNKKPSAVEMPPDGVQLLTWSEQILHRYQASHSQPPSNQHQRQPNRLSTIGPQEETHF